MKKKINLLEVLLWIMIIVLFIMILSRIFGKSSTDIQVHLAFFSSLIIVMGYIIKLNREVGEIKTQMINSFRKVKEDINKLQKKK